MNNKLNKGKGCVVGCLAAIGAFVVIFLLLSMIVGSSSKEETTTVSSEPATQSESKASVASEYLDENEDDSASSTEGKNENNNKSESEKENSDDTKKNSGSGSSKEADDNTKSENAEGSKKTNTSRSKSQTLVVSKPQIIEWKDYDGKPAYSYFFTYKNDSDSPILIKDIDVTAFDDKGVALGSVLCDYAPKYLEPGKVGYGGHSYINILDSNYPDSGATVEIETDFDLSPSSSEASPIKCVDARIIDATYATGTNVDKDVAIEVTLENSSNYRHASCKVVVGLIDGNGQLIGIAYGYCETVPANGRGKGELHDFILRNGESVDNISKLNARVDGGVEKD